MIPEPDDPQVDQVRWDALYYIIAHLLQVSFDEILQSSSLPDPGPDLYDARRRLWLTPRVKPATHPPSSSRQKLEFLLSQPDAIRNQDLWHHSLEKIWDGLTSGGRLKYRLPMNLIVGLPFKILIPSSIAHTLKGQDRTRCLVAWQYLANWQGGAWFRWNPKWWADC